MANEGEKGARGSWVFSFCRVPLCSCFTLCRFGNYYTYFYRSWNLVVAKWANSRSYCLFRILWFVCHFNWLVSVCLWMYMNADGWGRGVMRVLVQIVQHICFLWTALHTLHKQQRHQQASHTKIIWFFESNAAITVFSANADKNETSRAHKCYLIGLLRSVLVWGFFAFHSSRAQAMWIACFAYIWFVCCASLSTIWFSPFIEGGIKWVIFQ